MPGPADCDPGSDREPIADTFITGDGPEPDRMLADTNSGASTSLLIKSVPNLGFTRKIYITFDVANAPSFEQASLVLTVDSHIGAGPQPVNVFGITDGDDWKPNEFTETEIDQRDAITWNNAPRNLNSSAALMQFEQSPAVPLLIAGYDFDLGGDDVQDDPGTRYALDVTEYVKWAIGQNPGFSSALPDGDPDDQVSILMAVHNPMNLNEDGSVFFSKETAEACDRPFLHFE